ncbi:MAG TPA: hypothetical protein VF365_10610 [Candidatus Limnocylindria bacterium]
MVAGAVAADAFAHVVPVLVDRLFGVRGQLLRGRNGGVDLEDLPAVTTVEAAR